MKKILSIGVVMFFLFTISCFAGSDAVYERNRPQEIKGWSVAGSDDKISATPRLMTELDTTYAQLTAEDTIEVLSSRYEDISQTITVKGINNLGKQISEKIALSGSSPIPSSATFRYIDQVETNANCTGTVTVRKATGDTFIVSIPIGAVEATILQHFNGEKDSYVTAWNANVINAGSGVVFDLRYYPDDNKCLSAGTGYKVIDKMVLPEISSDSSFFAQPIKCPAGGWIAVYATGKSPNMDGFVKVQGYDIEQQ